MDFQESKTYQNLMTSYDGELNSSAKYEIYGIKAREDGFQQIGDIFDESARNEREHAEIWLKIMNDNQIPSTQDNLKDAAKNENYRWSVEYRKFAEIAREEGYVEIAELFDRIGRIERHHESRFNKLEQNIQTDSVFCKKREVVWICLNCGNVLRSRCAPEKCPVCGFPQGYFEVICENY